MKGWNIKNLDEVIQDYLIEMNTIPENQDDIGALRGFFFHVLHYVLHLEYVMALRMEYVMNEKVEYVIRGVEYVINLKCF